MERLNIEKLDIEKEEPKEVLRFFKEISDIPRESGNEKGIRDYLVKFASDRNLECYTDKYYNVIIRKIIDKNKDYLAFQAHTDMICEKESWSNQDFEKDPIELMKEGDFIKANGTSLGADNGIGVAFILALLDSKEEQKSNLECIFTVQEETTMIGAKLIDTNEIRSKRIISLDNGKEGKMVISSANCLEWFGKIDKEYKEGYFNPDEEKIYEIKYENFLGGHSGGNIADVKRGNPIKLGIEIISKLDNVYISKINGGSAVNIIPRDFDIVFSTSSKNEAAIKNEIKKQTEFYGNNVKIIFKEVEKREKLLSKDVTKRIIDFVSSYVNGALEFDKNNNQILSANFAAIREFDDYIRLEYSLRSNDMKLRDVYLENLNKSIKRNNIEIVWSQELFGFEPDYSSSLVTSVENIYKDMFNSEMEKRITQGVLEGGFFKNRIKDLEYICIGAETYDVHSPKERVSISSINRVWKLLIQIMNLL